MSIISEQVKELRECIEECNNPLYDMKMKRIAKLMNQAADTIESLSAKLQAANMERSAEGCGGWIYCGDGKNLPKEKE